MEEVRGRDGGGEGGGGRRGGGGRERERGRDRERERKSGVEGKRVDLGGRRIIKKKQNTHNDHDTHSSRRSVDN